MNKVIFKLYAKFPATFPIKKSILITQEDIAGCCDVVLVLLVNGEIKTSSG